MTEKPIPKSWTYAIDIAGVCNLRCPSCPVGNVVSKNSSGVMSLELFNSIIDKIKEECPTTPKIDLFNWGEPTINKDLPAMVSRVHAEGWFCGISTNLNLTDRIDLLTNNVASKIRLSVSGWFQKNYQLTHKGGDIETVKSNWFSLVNKLRKKKMNNRLEVCFHLYKHNQIDAIMWGIAANEAGARFSPCWSIFQPIEGWVEMVENRSIVDNNPIIPLLTINPLEMHELAKRYPVQDCRLRQRQTAINYDGSVALCCGIYDQSKYKIADNFLDIDHDELQNCKYEHDYCSRCFQVGVPSSLTNEYLNDVNKYSVVRLREANAQHILDLENGNIKIISKGKFEMSAIASSNQT